MGFYTSQLRTKKQREKFLGFSALALALWQAISCAAAGIWYAIDLTYAPNGAATGVIRLILATHIYNRFGWCQVFLPCLH